ncbi:hypothetical protein CTI12_AA162720 [Artemisia annua]|uniref:Uncharacterized protein n=1 Tax=Artemisia annua TaxID=35608 RepID=A0A2U1PDU8_ARTAN|nr:hypothetical protein CTI12_AA162720 [Artemisia annua]
MYYVLNEDHLAETIALDHMLRFKFQRNIEIRGSLESLVTNIHESLAQSPSASEDQRLQLSLYESTLPFLSINNTLFRYDGLELSPYTQEDPRVYTGQRNKSSMLEDHAQKTREKRVPSEWLDENQSLRAS